MRSTFFYRQTDRQEHGRARNDSTNTMMRKSKKARLEAKGWRFGTVQDFLGQSDEEAAYVELRLRLADSLR
jgi:hypothetical protein